MYLVLRITEQSPAARFTSGLMAWRGGKRECMYGQIWEQVICFEDGE